MSDARRHHYVPRLLLNRFAVDPAAKTPAIYQLEVGTGRCYRTATRDAAAIRDLYVVDTVPGAKPTLIEDGFADMESFVAPLLRKLDVPGVRLSEDERAEVLAFIMLLERRGPVGLGQLQSMIEAVTEMEHERLLGSPEDFRRAAIGAGLVDDGASLELSEPLRLEMLGDLEAGRISIEIAATRQHAIRAMLEGLPNSFPHIAELSWSLMRRSSGAPPFIIGDVPVVHVDSTPMPPSLAAAWRSSKNAQTTVPLTPDTCLLIWQAAGPWGDFEIDAADVVDVNLRTYAYASERVFGPTQHVLCEVTRKYAKSRPSLVRAYKRRPPMITTFTTELQENGIERHVSTESRAIEGNALRDRGELTTVPKTDASP